MSYTKEPWTEEMFGTQPFSSFKQVPKEDFERAIKCVNGCEGILDEDLDKFFKWARNMWFRQEKLVKEEQEKLTKMTDKEKAEYEARRESTLDYNLRSLGGTYENSGNSNRCECGCSCRR